MIISYIAIVFFLYLIINSFLERRKEGLTNNEESKKETKIDPDVQVYANAGDIISMKKQINELNDLAKQIKQTLDQNNLGITNNTALIQKVTQAQAQLQQKLSQMKNKQ